MARRPVKEATTGKHIGYGKVILFGEHVVVHGAPALVAGVSEYTEASLRFVPRPKTGSEPFVVVDNRPAVPGYKTDKRAEQRAAHELVLNHLKIDPTLVGNGEKRQDVSLELTLGGPLVPSSGIGASASDVVSLSRALNDMYALGLDEHAVNHSAWVGEGGYHGTPSGVDNTAATFGGLLVYQRDPTGKKPPQFTRMPCKKALYLVVVSTGITASTTSVVGEVRKMKEAKPEWFKGIMNKYTLVYEEARKAIESGDLARLGMLLNVNHELCRELTLTCKELDAIVLSARKHGALGAKMSGTGRGGIAVALCDSAEAQRRVADGVKADVGSWAAKFVWEYKVDPVVSSKL